jgi:hypothetical protein
MKNPLASAGLPSAAVVLAFIISAGGRLHAQVPDLTAGDPVPADPMPLFINLSPAGMEGWMYRSDQWTQ